MCDANLLPVVKELVDSIMLEMAQTLGLGTLLNLSALTITLLTIT